MPAAHPGLARETRRSELRTGEETGGGPSLHCAVGRGLDPRRSGIVSAAAWEGRQDRPSPSVAIIAGRHRTPVAGRARPRPCSRHLQSSVQFFPLPPGQHVRVFHCSIVIRSRLSLTFVYGVFRRRLHLPSIISVPFEQGVIRPVALPGHSQHFTTFPILRRRSLQQQQSKF